MHVGLFPGREVAVFPVGCQLTSRKTTTLGLCQAPKTEKRKNVFEMFSDLFLNDLAVAGLFEDLYRRGAFVAQCACAGQSDAKASVVCDAQVCDLTFAREGDLGSLCGESIEIKDAFSRSIEREGDDASREVESAAA